MAKRVSLKGKGADLFFSGDALAPSDPHPTSPSPVPGPEPLASPTAPAQPGGPRNGGQAAPSRTRVPSPPGVADGTRSPNRSTSTGAVPSGQRGNKAGAPANREPGTVEAIRRVVKVPGREVSFVRLTADEKARAAEIVYAYKRRGQKTSENEINRIALNYLLLDHEEHGEQSVLARVLSALQA